MDERQIQAQISNSIDRPRAMTAVTLKLVVADKNKISNETNKLIELGTL